MATTKTDTKMMAEQSLPPQVLEAEADAGPGATMSDGDQTVSAADTAKEKEMNNTAGYSSSEGSPVPEEMPADEKKGGAPQQEEKRPRLRIVLIMAALMMATFLAALDMTIVTTALPTIAEDFKVSEADYTWIGSCYLLGAAASTPIWGKFSDIFGRKPIMLVANVVFFVGSLICALSINVNMLLAGRVIQGIGGGGLIILSNICISDLFSMRSRGMYYGMIGMVWAFASAVGPVLGGVFTQLVTWRWCFYINLPCDGAAFLLLTFFLDVHTPRTPILQGLKAIDWLGSLTIVGGTVMFLIGLEFGGVSYPWSSPTVVCLIVFGVIVMALFFPIEHWVAKYPLMPLSIFSSRSNIAALGTCFFHGWTFIAGSYYLPLYFQAVIGASPLLSGVYLFPYVLSLSFMSAFAGIIIRKTGRYRPMVWFGTFFMALGFGLYINFPAYPSWPRIIIFQIVAGIGVGPNFQAPLIALQTKIRPRDIAAATATFGFTRNLATAMSVVIGGVIFQNQMGQHSAQLAGLPPQTRQLIVAGSAGASTSIVNALPPAQKEPVLDAYAQSLSTMWIFYTVTGCLAFAFSLMIGGQTLSKDHQEVKTGIAAQEEERLERLQRQGQRRSKRASRGKDLEAQVDKAGKKEAEGA
ncbi:MAG: hypothetical protein LQ340_006084 [Diploschistes diacapsis]|nr:MAG: hypothetical protein LQ340_006084 [Diploschistes diacapsis]